MSKLRLCSTSNNSQIAAPVSLPPVLHPFQFTPTIFRINVKVQKATTREISASKSSGFPLGSIMKGCQTCGGKGAIECPGCKGTGKNKKNGNIFERWKCFDCQGFGLRSCPKCGRGGLTPEQRGER